MPSISCHFTLSLTLLVFVVKWKRHNRWNYEIIFSSICNGAKRIDFEAGTSHASQPPISNSAKVIIVYSCTEGIAWLHSSLRILSQTYMSLGFRASFRHHHFIGSEFTLQWKRQPCHWQSRTAVKDGIKLNKAGVGDHPKYFETLYSRS